MASAKPGLYRSVISRAFSIAWVHKHLWLFGFFAAVIGFGGIGDVLINVFDTNLSLSPFIVGQVRLFAVIPGGPIAREVIHGSRNPALAMTALILLCLSFLAAFAWTASVSVGALIAAVRKVAKGGDLHFSQGIAAGAPPAVTLLGIQIATKIAVAIVYLITGIGLFVLFRERTPLGAAAYILAFAASAVAVVIASLVAVFASNEAVLNGKKFDAATASAWRFFAKHWLTAVEMALLLTVCIVLIGIAAMLATLVAFVPVFFFFVLAAALKAKAAVVALFALSAVVLVVAAVATGSLAATFQTAAWTLLWTELEDKTHIPLLHRMMRAIRNAINR